jgi:hypothetical protein
MILANTPDQSCSDIVKDPFILKNHIFQDSWTRDDTGQQKTRFPCGRAGLYIKPDITGRWVGGMQSIELNN